MKDILYENKKFRLRKPKHRDTNDLFNLTQDSEVMRYYGMGAMKDIKEAEGEIKWFMDLFDDNCGRWIIADKDTDTYIGDIGFFNYSRQHKRVEIGFKLNRDYWNRGIASDCLRVLLSIGFKEFKYNRIEALVDDRNIPCKMLLEKTGFSKEGLLREYEFEFGEYVNLVMYSFLKREYK